MMICKRCRGYIDMTYHEHFDPSCINCGCTYPELGTSENGTKERKGIKETIRYTGKFSRMKNTLSHITYSRHPNMGHISPKLTVECPYCIEEIEVLSSLADPSYKSHNTTFKDGYKTAKSTITCPTGHSFRLRINEEEEYSWAE